MYTDDTNSRSGYPVLSTTEAGERIFVQFLEPDPLLVIRAAATKSQQFAMELKERDIRVLVRSLQRWGDIRQRYDDIVSLYFTLNR